MSRKIKKSQMAKSQFDPQHLASLLRTKREAEGMSMRELARRVGAATTTIQRLERNSDEKTVQLDTLVKILDELGIAVAEIVPAIERHQAPSLEKAIEGEFRAGRGPEMLRILATCLESSKKRPRKSAKL